MLNANTSYENKDMKIAVCIKQVPDTATRLKISDDNKTIDKNGIKYEINPYDEYALEGALKIKDKDSNVEITIISAGPERVKQSLTKALATGADNAIHILIEEDIDNVDFIADTIAKEINKQGFDLILFGKKSVDQDNNQIGIMVGEINKIPCISNCSEFSLNNDTITANRETESGIEVFEGILPLIITHEKGKNELRYPSLKDLMAAKKKTINIVNVNTAEKSNSKLIKLEYPAQREEGIIIDGNTSAVPELIRILREERKLI